MSLWDSIAKRGASVSGRKADTAIGARINRLPPKVRGQVAAAYKGFKNNGTSVAGLKSTARGMVNASGLPPELKGLLKDLIGYSPIELMGGITAQDALDIYKASAGTDFAKKNLFFISVESLEGASVFKARKPAVAEKGNFITDLAKKGVGKIGEMLGMDILPKTKVGYSFNMFATEVQYSPWTITGNAENIGSGSYDVLTNSERVELQITTLDDKHGSIKRWFEKMASSACNFDGTFNYPTEYLMRVKIVHGFIFDSTDKDKKGKLKAPGAFVDEYIVRAGKIDYAMSRREDALQELQFSLVQYDTFGTFGNPTT